MPIWPPRCWVPGVVSPCLCCAWLRSVRDGKVEVGAALWAAVAAAKLHACAGSLCRPSRRRTEYPDPAGAPHRCDTTCSRPCIIARNRSKERRIALTGEQLQQQRKETSRIDYRSCILPACNVGLSVALYLTFPTLMA
jgi:hypothetical protein